MKGFASDNASGVHPKIMEKLVKINKGHEYAYGDDNHTRAAIKKFKEVFGNKVSVYFVYNGTAANVLGISGVTNSYHSILATDISHLNVDECSALERFSGNKIVPIPNREGKIFPDQLVKPLEILGFEHDAQPKMISITQATELGTVYTVSEIKRLAAFAHKNGLFLHMDGARLANAAVSLNSLLKEITFDVGVDIVSFGGTKNGMMFGEAIIFANENLAKDFKFIRKQGMQLASKMRFISVQFETLLSNNLWLENAKNSNLMAKLLVSKLRKIKEVKITHPVDANEIFMMLPKVWVEKLLREFQFYVWDKEKSEIRLVTSFDTTEEEINQFVDKIRRLQKSNIS